MFKIFGSTFVNFKGWSLTVSLTSKAFLNWASRFFLPYIWLTLYSFPRQSMKYGDAPISSLVRHITMKHIAFHWEMSHEKNAHHLFTPLKARTTSRATSKSHPYRNRELKHRQRNGTTTTGGSKIFPREGSAHVRCCQNVVQPSSTTESQQNFVLVKT